MSTSRFGDPVADPADQIRAALEATIRTVPGFTGPPVWWTGQVQAALAALDALQAERDEWKRIAEGLPMASEQAVARVEAAEKERDMAKDEIEHLLSVLLLANTNTKRRGAALAAAEKERDEWESRYEELLSEVGGVWPR